MRVSERSRERKRSMNGSNEFNCHNRITQINWDTATHLDYRAPSHVLHTYTYVHLCSQ